MQIQKERLKEDFNRDIYWSRIHLASEDSSKQSKVLVYASFEYFQQRFGKNKFEESDFASWFDEVVSKWSALGEEVFNQDVHYDVYTTTQESKKKGLEYLMEQS